ncbi:LysR substrate-binding domain-containing protein [Sphingomonas sp. MS122]|uniref:LysR substrate-binding domain-containing protein n=1 Tax=Sphingomonas sp. MS122 TaxID=3412683 RepID=UPI003C2B0FD5
MRNLPPLAAVRVFEAAARRGNFTRAAEELGMTQAAVSNQVKLLEARLGIPLFRKEGRGVVLTPLGERIAPQVSAAFDGLAEAFAAARAEDDSVITISAPTTFAANWLAARLGGFQVSRPDLAVRVRVSDAVVDLAAGDADVAIRGAPGPWPGMVSHFLMRMPFTVLASPAFLARHPPIRTPADLLHLPRVSPDDRWWQLWFDTVLDDKVEISQPGIGFESQVHMGSAAIAGHGLAVLSPAMWLPALATGQLVQVLPYTVYYRNSFWLVYPESKRHTPKIRAFRDWLLAEVRASLGDDPYSALVPPPA